MGVDVQVAIVGGGIVGCSVLYHLARAGWSDAVLLERRELTSGSTWHAAGNTTHFGPYAAMTRLFAGSIDTYLAAEAESGQSVGFHQTGSLRVAESAEERAVFESYCERYSALGVPYEIVENDRVVELNPLIHPDGLFGAAHTPADGHVDPVGATQALAQAARARGATVERWRPVERLEKVEGGWRLETAKGPVTAAHVVMAASYWSRALLRPLGLDLPLYGIEHHELITEAIPALEALDREVPALRDSWFSGNVRQEGKGVLVGIYEADPVFWALDGIPTDFGEELFAPNIDRLMPHLERLIERVPAFGEAGIKLVNNGPLCFTPDGVPLLGPVQDHAGLWLATGFNVGVGTGGGSGAFLAAWMTEGAPPFDLPIVDPARFGSGMAQAEAMARITRAYGRGYRLPELSP